MSLIEALRVLASLGQLLEQQVRWLVRWPKGYHLIDTQGLERKVWQMAQGKRSGSAVRSGMDVCAAFGSSASWLFQSKTLRLNTRSGWWSPVRGRENAVVSFDQ